MDAKRYETFFVLNMNNNQITATVGDHVHGDCHVHGGVFTKDLQRNTT